MMPTWRVSPVRRGLVAAGAVLTLTAVPMTALFMALAGSSTAAATAVDLGTAKSFGVLGGQSVTNTGPSVISGDLGVSPGTALTGFTGPPGGTVLGSVHAADPVATQAQSDLTVAYNAVAGQASDELISDNLGGRTLTTGVYTASSTMALTGALTLDAQGNSSAVFVFQVGSGLTIASGATITLTNGATACNIFWQVGSSATLGTGATFRGTVLALTSISAGTGATIEGRLLARNGSVTLDTNMITQPTCETPGSESPGTESPSSEGPGTEGPGTEGPGTEGPGTEGPGTEGPGTEGPGTEGPGVESPGVEGPGAGVPGEDQPGTKQIGHTPKGFPNTGDGGSMDSGRAMVAGGILALIVAGILVLWWRRGTSTE
jgi:hypothetical protein